MFRLLMATALAAATLFAQSDFQLKDQDTVVFYGDSITDQRLYTTFVETYTLTRFPQRKIRFVHSGWGGDRVTGGGGGSVDTRLKRDVYAYRPTVMTIMLGMNDGSYRAYDEAIFKKYADGYEHIIDDVKKQLPDVRITVIEPSPYDDVTRPTTFEGGYNQVLLKYSDFLRDLSERRKLLCADLNNPVTAMLTKAYATDATAAPKIIPDRVHPGASGHLAMAQALLAAWNAPAVVTSVEIDAGAGKATVADNTNVTELQTGDKLTWTQQDQALPMPVNLKDPLVALVAKSSDFMNALNQETLRVKGLSGDRYTLSINGAPVGAFGRDELAQGINLAAWETPMSKQAAAVHALTLKRNNVHFARWRTLEVPLADEQPAHLAEALAAMDKVDEDLAAQQRTMAKPMPCRYELSPEVKQSER